MYRKGVLVRDIARSECPWLDGNLPKGKVVYGYINHTYGCIGPGGIAVSDEPDKTPFYEIPTSAVSWE